MHVVDSSGWIEFFVGGHNAGLFDAKVQDHQNLLVPTIVLHEVGRFLIQKGGRDAALEATLQMRRGLVVDLDASIAFLAARLGIRYQLPSADSIVYATAQSQSATLWTQDDDFQKLPGVRYIRKR